MTGKDHFSRMAVAYPLHNKTADATAEILKRVLNEWGKPGIVQTDNGTEFKGSFEKVLKENCIKHIRGRPYHPESQGSIEAFNRALKYKIPLYIRDSKKHYSIEDLLPKFLQEYNYTQKVKQQELLLIPYSMRPMNEY